MVSLYCFYALTQGKEAFELAFSELLVFVVFGIGSYYLRKWAQAIKQRAAQMEVGIPLTRANTADLPAPETLVRASEEPIQEPQTVLLRAAGQGQETPPEQLVRPTEGLE